MYTLYSNVRWTVAKRREIDVTARTSANADAVFALLADGTTWPNWAPIESFELERAGDPPPEGVGAIRVFKRGRVTGRDEIVELVPGSRLGYVSISGLAIKDYRATVDVGDAGDDTWRCRHPLAGVVLPEDPRHGCDPPPRHPAVPPAMRRRARPEGCPTDLSSQSSKGRPAYCSHTEAWAWTDEAR